MGLSDRTVYGQTADGGAIVRYDRASKWYVEYPAERLVPRRRVSIGEAAALAAKGTARRGLSRGFDRKLDEALRGGK